jgi:hypothetical protein
MSYCCRTKRKCRLSLAWYYGDGVLDKDDKCPEVKGTVANKGCPEVSEAVMMKLNEYSRTILFDSVFFQKTNLSNVSVNTEILKEYPYSRF